MVTFVRRWILALLGRFPVTLYGAKGDGVTDDTSAFQKAVDAAAKHSHTHQ